MSAENFHRTLLVKLLASLQQQQLNDDTKAIVDQVNGEFMTNQQQQQTDNNNHEELVNLCQTMLNRLQNKESAFSYIQFKLHKGNHHAYFDDNKGDENSEGEETEENSPKIENDTSVNRFIQEYADFDFLFPQQNEEKTHVVDDELHHNQQKQQKVADRADDHDDVITILCNKIVQLETEKQNLAATCQTLSVHLRNSRLALRDASRKMELQSWRSLEDVTKMQNYIDLIKESATLSHNNNNNNNNAHLIRNQQQQSKSNNNNTASYNAAGGYTLNSATYYQPGVIMNVASTQTIVSGGECILTIAESEARRKKRELDEKNNILSGGTSATTMDDNYNGTNFSNHQQQDSDFVQNQNESLSSTNNNNTNNAANVDPNVLLASISDPLDRIYMQSFPSLGVGMILQTLATVFKREYDVKLAEDIDAEDAASSAEVDRLLEEAAAAVAAAATATSTNSMQPSTTTTTPTTTTATTTRRQILQRLVKEQSARTANMSDADVQLDESQRFESACLQFQLALRKDVLPLVESLPTLQQQLGMLLGTSASMRADYVTRCLGMKIKPNSGVMKALTAVAATDRRRIRAFDCSNFLVGDLGAAALCTSVLESMYRLERLDLRANNLHPNGIRSVCAAVRRHPSIKEVDLRGNPVGRSGAKMLLTLATEVPRINKIVIDDTAVDDPLQERIQKELERNKLKQQEQE